MIEIIVKDFLKKHLKRDVYLEYPLNRKDGDFILIEKTGGDVNNHLLSAVLAIQSYGDSMYKAAILNEMVKEAMSFLANDKRISAVKLNSDYNFTDTDMKKYRYQAVFDIYYYKGERIWRK